MDVRVLKSAMKCTTVGPDSTVGVPESVERIVSTVQERSVELKSVGLSVSSLQRATTLNANEKEVGSDSDDGFWSDDEWDSEGWSVDLGSGDERSVNSHDGADFEDCAASEARLEFAGSLQLSTSAGSAGTLQLKGRLWCDVESSDDASLSERRHRPLRKTHLISEPTANRPAAVIELRAETIPAAVVRSGAATVPVAVSEPQRAMKPAMDKPSAIKLLKP